MTPDQSPLPGVDSPSKPLKAHEDPARNPYLLQRSRLDPATGASLWYAAWRANGWPQGHFVRRWDAGSKTWGDEFALSPAGMARTRPAPLPEGAIPPRDPGAEAGRKR